ncbi:hypothetical protein BG015_011554 [Linnemannia schmuckeri]|uniref:Major facilitator superfamily (MFS) profile domain-containing protein n=1 Tax=Linnemannia schmuckeri TaxID=64567 RepID=A0A9P5V7T1_9FUNG|nr:hypothetical protein BG015_011554 [Linnemannia schmuckeri]
MLADPSQLKGIDYLRQRLRSALLYVVSTAQFFDIVNGASVLMAFLQIAQDLDCSMTEVLWIPNAYTISFAGLLLLSGLLRDLFDHRRIFMAGLFWFALWALIISFSTSPLMFILACALQGMGAASTVPTAMVLITTKYPPGPERTKVLSVFGIFDGLDSVTGTLFAGGLAERPKVGFLGVVSATIGVTGIVYYIFTGINYGWANAKTLPTLVVSLVLLVSFRFIENRV